MIGEIRTASEAGNPATTTLICCRTTIDRSPGTAGKESSTLAAGRRSDVTRDR